MRVAMCGVTRMHGSPQKGWWAGSGSCEKASSVAAEELAKVQRAQQVGFDQMRATPYVDQVRATRQPREQVRVQKALRLRRERQQAHQRVAAREEFVELRIAVKARDTGRQFGLGAAAPAAHRIADGGQRLGVRPAPGAEPRDARHDGARARLIGCSSHTRRAALYGAPGICRWCWVTAQHTYAFMPVAISGSTMRHSGSGAAGGGRP